MPYNRRDMGDALSDDRTWSHEVGSYSSSGSPNIVVDNFPKGSYATTRWAENRRAIATEAVREVFAGAPAGA
jgi:hypothetical protein